MHDLVFKANVRQSEDENYHLCYEKNCKDCKEICFEAVVKIIPVLREDVSSTVDLDFISSTNRATVQINKLAEALRAGAKTFKKLK